MENSNIDWAVSDGFSLSEDVLYRVEVVCDSEFYIHSASLPILEYLVVKSNIKEAYFLKNQEFQKNDTTGLMEDLIGLDEIKREIDSLANFMKMQIRRRKKGLKNVPVSMHLVFLGNPGTGKTTIARNLGTIYNKIGVLSKGHVVEVDRSDLVAGYIGQTALKTKQKIEEAFGGILFVDEAYSLVKEGNDFGQEAIETILKAMEDYREDFVVIVAGYRDLMERFLNSNPGLKSRFNKFIYFPDFSVEELIEIFVSMCEKYQYRLTESAKTALRKKISGMVKNKELNFANARDIRNLFEETIKNQATRISNSLSDDMMLIIDEDIL